MFLQSIKKIKVTNILLVIASLTIGVESLSPGKVNAHGGGNDEPLGAGEFRKTPYLLLEGHHGVENSKENSPMHHGLDAGMGIVMDWGLKNEGIFSIETYLSPVLVWGEADHFYGVAHHEEEEEEEHEAHNTDFKRVDLRGLLRFKYLPNERLSFSLDSKPHLVTKTQGEEKKGVKNEIGAKALYKLGEGDVNFALGDQLSDIIDGTFLSLEHRQGWESDGKWQGHYTDPRVGVKFNYDLLSFKIEGGPRLYKPKSGSGLSNRTDFAGEIEVSRPIGDKTELFFHWQPTYSDKDGDEWSQGWNHHIGTGIVFTF